MDAAGLVRTLAMSGEAADHGPLPGAGRRLPRHGAARRADPRLHFRAEDRSSISTRRPNGRNSAWCPSELCTDEQFIRRLSLDLTGTLPTPTQVTAFLADTDAEQARQAGRSRCWNRRNTATSSPTNGRTSCASSAAARAEPGQRHVRVPRLDSRGDRQRQALRPVRPRDPRRQRRRDRQSADGLVQGTAGAASSSSTTRPRCSSACGWRAPSAITIPTRSGARTITGAWPPSSAASAARTSRCPASSTSSRWSARPSSTARPAASSTSAPARPP